MGSIYNGGLGYRLEREQENRWTKKKKKKTNTQQWTQQIKPTTKPVGNSNVLRTGR